MGHTFSLIEGQIEKILNTDKHGSCKQYIREPYIYRFNAKLVMPKEETNNQTSSSANINTFVGLPMLCATEPT